MLSNHTLCETVENNLYPRAKQIQQLVVDLYHKQFATSFPGPQGMTGSNELDYTIQLLDGAINLLLDIAREQHIEVSRFFTLYLKNSYKSKDGKNWTEATEKDLANNTLYRLEMSGQLLLPSK
jgi:hypothetical protein